MEELVNKITTGDAREMTKLIPDESIDLIFTDPVYDKIEDYEWLSKEAMRILKPNSACLVFYGIGYLPQIIEATKLLTYRWQGIWYQSNNMQRADMGFCNYSPFLWLEKGRSKVVKQTGDVANIPIPGGRDNHNHKWNKRPKLISRYLSAFAKLGDLIFDPFCGGGTIPSVCKMLGYNYIAFEIDPDTAELARERVLNTQPPLFVLEPEQLELETGGNNV